jgi:hypothetical protein
MKERRSDFELLQLFKDGDSYIFTAENSKKPLAREAFTNLINKFIKDCARRMDRNPNISSHSFRVGYYQRNYGGTPMILNLFGKQLVMQKLIQLPNT